MENSFIKITEQSSRYHHLEKMNLPDILKNINEEDKTVPLAVEKAIPQIVNLVSAITDRVLAGGRLFYIGAGTSGRLGILDASEIPPTYGLPQGIVIGIIAGGEKAIQNSIEKAEDNKEQGWHDLEKFNVNEKDIVIGISAGGATPYVVNALKECRKRNIATGSICSNYGAPLSSEADFPVEVIVGPEFVTASTRMKSGTAQKLVLNMISTAVMIQIGRVEDNKMVNMQLTNEKLIDRGTKMVMAKLNINDYEKAKKLLLKYGSVSATKAE